MARHKKSLSERRAGKHCKFGFRKKSVKCKKGPRKSRR
jgi:hypothetical protein